jgi:hypothetical protein
MGPEVRGGKTRTVGMTRAGGPLIGVPVIVVLEVSPGLAIAAPKLLASTTPVYGAAGTRIPSKGTLRVVGDSKVTPSTVVDG